MRESRTQESARFKNFFEIVRKEAEKRNAIFFIECGEGRNFIDGNCEGEDLSGWLIPKSEADEFEHKWRNNETVDKWLDKFTFAVWKREDKDITVTFKTY